MLHAPSEGGTGEFLAAKVERGPELDVDAGVLVGAKGAEEDQAFVAVEGEGGGGDVDEALGEVLGREEGGVVVEEGGGEGRGDEAEEEFLSVGDEGDGGAERGVGYITRRVTSFAMVMRRSRVEFVHAALSVEL